MVADSMILNNDFDLKKYEFPTGSCRPGRKVIKNKIHYTYTVNNISSFADTINVILQRMKLCKKIPHQLWYRGHADSKYVLLPTLLREYTASAHESSSLIEYHRSNIEDFLIKSHGASELQQHRGVLYKNALIECIAEMQHYRVPTNLLDWSENPFVSLYFACENVIQRKETLNGTVYVLNPHLYNVTRAHIIKQFLKLSGNHKTSEQKRNEETIISKGNLLPYMGVPYNIESDHLRDFVYGPDISTLFPEKDRVQTNPLDEYRTYQDMSDRKPIYAPLFPIAIQVPRTTPRMQSQSGTFVAFNLCTQPTQGDERFLGFSHVELEEIQKFYLECDNIDCLDVGQESKGVKVPFLYRIDLKQEHPSEFSEFLEAIAITEEKLYPELYRIGAKIQRSNPL